MKRFISIFLLFPLLAFGEQTVSTDSNHTGHRIYNVMLTPPSDSDVATKKYVDDSTAGTFDGLFNDLDFTGSNITSIETRSYNDLQDLPNLNFGSHKISGGEVVWTGTGLNFIVSACDYVINGVQFHSDQTPITLDPSDPAEARIDVFAVNTSSAAVALTGTPAGPPVEPQVDPATQLKLTSVLIPANATEPSFTNENIYLENTEWTMSASAGSINVNATNRPYAGSKNIHGTNTPTGVFFTGVKPSGTLAPNDYTVLVFQIFCEAAWPNPKSMSIFFMNGASTVGTAVTLKNGVFGFNTSNTTTYQQIAIPASQFNTGASVVDRIRFGVAGGGGNISWDIDNIILQAGTVNPPPTGGDFSTNTSTSVVGEAVLFADTTGKLGKRSTGTGYATLTSGVLGAGTPAALTRTDDTNVTLTLGGTPATALLQATSLTLGWTGTLAISRGGWGKAMTDPNADRLTAWDDTDGDFQFVTVGSGLTYTHATHTLTATGSGGSVTSITATAPIVVTPSPITSTGVISVTAAALTKTDDTNVTLTLGGTPTTALLAATSITAGWTGQLSLARGGTAASLSDPNADKILAWDDTDGTMGFWTVGTGLSYTHATHTLAATAQAQTRSVTFVVDGGGGVLQTGTQHPVKIPYGGTLQGWLLIASPSGSVTVDVLRAADGAGLPVTSIVGGGGTKPALSSAVEASSTSFTGWTSTTLTAKDNVAVSLSGVSTSTYCALTLYFQ